MARARASVSGVCLGGGEAGGESGRARKRETQTNLSCVVGKKSKMDSIHLAWAKGINPQQGGRVINHREEGGQAFRNMEP
eukprot:5703569-Karenia_brevis.AAC.1